MKKLLVGVVVLCLSPLAFASGVYVAPTYAAAPVGKSVFDGFYLGIGPSLVATTGKAKTDFDSSPLKYTVFGYPGTEELPLSDYKFGVSGFGGYGITFYQNYYLGGELFANYSPVKTFGAEWNFTDGRHWYATQVKSDYTLGAALRIGYLLSQKSMIYALVGGDYTSFKVKSIDSTMTANRLIGVSPSLTKHVIGFIPGIGMETMLTKNWALRGQYTYSLHQSFSDTYTGLRKDLETIIHAKTKYDLNRSTFNLAAVYHFNPQGTQNTMLPLSSNPGEFLNRFYLGLGPELTAVTGETKQVAPDVERLYKGISSFYPGITGVGGYGIGYQKWYMGGELFADYSPVKSEVKLDGGNIHISGSKIESDYNLGAALRGGYLFSPKSLVYVLMGADFTQFKLRTTKTNWADPNVYIETPQATKNVVGFMPGIGFESMINHNLSARIQYAYFLYPTLKDQGTKYEVARSRLTALLTYYFNFT
ncbi:MAG: hypothetical protein AMJ43_01675 [Coxiella sp. DG_40]|nr:MAG: hypothetical protein AMJ43_01675 [Coxiella sp. DG_40]